MFMHANITGIDVTVVSPCRACHLYAILNERAIFANVYTAHKFAHYAA